MTETAISVRGLDHFFGEGEARKQALFDVNLDVDRGSLTILLGPSGSGKTTLLTILGCLREVHAGSVRLLDQELSASGEAARIDMRRRLGFVFQAHNLHDSLTARFDFLTLMARDTRGVVDAWRTSIVTALEDKGHKESPLDHKLVAFLMGDFVREIAELEARKAELDAQVKAATAKPEEDEEGDEEEDADPVDEAQIKRWKKELTEVKKTLKAKREQFAAELNKGVDGLSSLEAADLLLKILHDDMEKILTRYIAAQRGRIVAAFENWWDKYRVTLTEIEGARAQATEKLDGFLKGLGYV